MKTDIQTTTFDSLSAAQSLRLGLDYPVTKHPLSVNTATPEERELGIAKWQPDTSGDVKLIGKGIQLGTVGENYGIHQPRTIFNLVMDTTLNIHIAKYTVTHMGAKLIIDCEMEKKTIAVKVGDIVKWSVRFVTSFDGSLKTKIYLYSWRLWCSNGCTHMKAVTTVSVKHTAKSEDRLIVKASQFQKTLDTIPAISAQMVKMAETPVTYREREDLIRQILPAKDEDNVSTRLLNQRNEILTLSSRGAGNNGRTLWDLWNGVTEYTNHHMGTRDTQRTTAAANRFESNLRGTGASIANRAFDLLVNLVD